MISVKVGKYLRLFDAYDLKFSVCLLCKADDVSCPSPERKHSSPIGKQSHTDEDDRVQNNASLVKVRERYKHIYYFSEHCMLQSFAYIEKQA